MEWHTGTDRPCILPGPHFRANFPSVKIEIVRGQARELVRPVAGPVFLIGGGNDCDLVLGDPQYPEVFAYLFITEQGVSLRHLGAGPILTVNGRVTQATSLFDGDILRTGRYVFHIHVDWDSGPEPTPNRRNSASVSELAVDEGISQVEELLCEVRGLLADVRDSLAGPGDGGTDPNAVTRNYRATG